MVRQLLCSNCPPSCPCAAVSFPVVSWGEPLRRRAGRRAFGWAVGAEEAQRCAFTPRLGPRSSPACPCLRAGSVPQRFPGRLPGAIKESFWEALVSSARQQIVGRIGLNAVKKSRECLFSPMWKSRVGRFPARCLRVETFHAASVSSSSWHEIVSCKKKRCPKEMALPHHTLKATASRHGRHGPTVAPRSAGVSGADGLSGAGRGARCEGAPGSRPPSPEQVLGTCTAPFCSRARGILGKHRGFLPQVPFARRASSFWHFDLWDWWRVVFSHMFII